jgi:prolipoprotein diacylglyceryl transferase
LWYGVLFASGFFFGYLVLRSLLITLFQSKQKANAIADQFLLFCGIGAVLGARLIDVFLYQEVHEWIHRPWEIFSVWKGGLSSHGAACGVLIGLALLTRRLRRRGLAKWPVFRLLDLAVVPAALIGAFIRIGNFINQEILGKATALPWGVLFLHPADGGEILARHPVQLYESVAYLALFFLQIWLFWKKHLYEQVGLLSGWFLLLCFGGRFCLEFFKEEQSALIYGDFPLTMGQMLSIPLIIFGVYLVLRKKE